jgi:mRNA interferase RelE/StbE
MRYTITLTDIAKQMLNEISDQRIRKKIGDRIDELVNNPELQGKPLKGPFLGYRSVRAVGQRYRVVYGVEKEKVIVLVVGVGIRKEGSKRDIYARLKKLIQKMQSGR